MWDTQKKSFLDLGAFVGCHGPHAGPPMAGRPSTTDNSVLGIGVGRLAHPDIGWHVSLRTPCSRMAQQSSRGSSPQRCSSTERELHRLADARFPLRVARRNPNNQCVRAEKGSIHGMAERVSTRCIQCAPDPLCDVLRNQCVRAEKELLHCAADRLSARCMQCAPDHLCTFLQCACESPE